MNIAYEAAYLFVYAKKLQSVTNKLKSLSKDAEHHLKKHNATQNPKDKEHHKQKHHKTTTKLQDLIKRHNELLNKIHHHQLLFASTLQKEHKIK